MVCGNNLQCSYRNTISPEQRTDRLCRKVGNNSEDRRFGCVRIVDVTSKVILCCPYPCIKDTDIHSKTNKDFILFL
jgi:hypothetical protein